LQSFHYPSIRYHPLILIQKKEKNLMKKMVIFTICMMFFSSSAYAADYISSISETQILYGKNTTATLWAKVSPPAGVVISRVWAEINPPVGVKSILELSDTDNDLVYEGVYTQFTQQGDYVIFFYADNVVSEKIGTVSPQPAADDYEPDDDLTQATPMIVNSETLQQHNFHNYGDTDWVKIYGFSGNNYRVGVNNLSNISNAIIEVYAPDKTTRIAASVNDDSTAGKSVSVEWKCSQDGVYYVKLSNFKPDISGANANYEFAVSIPDAPPGGRIEGTVKNALTNQALGKVIIKTSQKSSAISSNNGYYVIEGQQEGTYILTAEADGYETHTASGMLKTSETLEYNIFLCPAGLQRGDLNGDNAVNLKDAILALKVLSGFTGRHCNKADVNGDNRISMEEVIYILQKAAGLR
jgi:hypothetical protein